MKVLRGQREVLAACLPCCTNSTGMLCFFELLAKLGKLGGKFGQNNFCLDRGSFPFSPKRSGAEVSPVQIASRMINHY